MSTRCKACDAQLTRGSAPPMNKFSKIEEDLCSVCRYLSQHASTEPEYVGGAYPTNGVTQPVQTSV